MPGNEWPATAKQRAYIYQLEQRLGEVPCYRDALTVAEASDRIAYLIRLRHAQHVIDSIAV